MLRFAGCFINGNSNPNLLVDQYYPTWCSSQEGKTQFKHLLADAVPADITSLKGVFNGFYVYSPNICTRRLVSRSALREHMIVWEPIGDISLLLLTPRPSRKYIA